MSKILLSQACLNTKRLENSFGSQVAKTCPLALGSYPHLPPGHSPWLSSSSQQLSPPSSPLLFLLSINRCTKQPVSHPMGAILICPSPLPLSFAILTRADVFFFFSPAHRFQWKHSCLLPLFLLFGFFFLNDLFPGMSVLLLCISEQGLSDFSRTAVVDNCEPSCGVGEWRQVLCNYKCS